MYPTDTKTTDVFLSYRVLSYSVLQSHIHCNKTANGVSVHSTQTVTRVLYFQNLVSWWAISMEISWTDRVKNEEG